MDPGNAALTIALTGVALSYESRLPLTLCDCALSLGSGSREVPLTLAGSSCATVSKERPALDVGATARPDGVLAAALLGAIAGSGGAVMGCSASVLGVFTRRVEAPLGAPSRSALPWRRADDGEGGAPAAPPPPSLEGGTPAAPLPPLFVPILRDFEGAYASPMLETAALRAALPFPLRAIHVTSPGATLALFED